MAEKASRVGGRTIDLLITGIAVVIVLRLVGDGERPFASLAVAWLVLWLYDLGFTVWLGGTPGKRMTNQVVAELDRVGRPELPVAARRAAVTATLISLPVIGWALGLVITLTDPLGRGLADRAAQTMVVPERARQPVRTTDLPGYADAVRAPRLTTRGRVGEVDVRGRARLRRLDDSPVLAVAIGILTAAASVPFVLDTVSALGVVIAATTVWLVCFVVSETRMIHRYGATPGHELAGLVVVDARTGDRPGTGRSLARALTLGLTLYVPLLWPLLLISVAMMRWSATGRSLHDLAGRTGVVADPTLDPETQRQRAMRMRLGRAG